jgi:hypothetical protein
LLKSNIYIYKASPSYLPWFLLCPNILLRAFCQPLSLLDPQRYKWGPAKKSDILVRNSFIILIFGVCDVGKLFRDIHVFFEIRIECLNNINTSFGFKGLK